jgi:hypothetical protein
MTCAPRSVAGTLGWSKSGMRQHWQRQPDDDPASQWASPRFVMVSTQRETPLAFVHSAADRWRDAQYLWGLLRCAGIVGGGSQDWPPIGSLSASGNRSRMRQRAGKTGASHGPFSAPGHISPRFVMVSSPCSKTPAHQHGEQGPMPSRQDVCFLPLQ